MFLLIAHNFTKGCNQKKEVCSEISLSRILPSFYNPTGWPLSTPVVSSVGQGYIVIGLFHRVRWVLLEVDESLLRSFLLHMSPLWMTSYDISTDSRRACGYPGTIVRSFIVVGSGCLWAFTTSQCPTANTFSHWWYLPAPLWLEMTREGFAPDFRTSSYMTCGIAESSVILSVGLAEFWVSQLSPKSHRRSSRHVALAW
jgi:hypothetical protein